MCPKDQPTNSLFSVKKRCVEGFWFLYFRTLETHIANESETLWRIQPSCCLCYDCMCSADSSNKLSSNPSKSRDQRPSKLVKQSQGSASANKSVARSRVEILGPERKITTRRTLWPALAPWDVPIKHLCFNFCFYKDIPQVSTSAVMCYASYASRPRHARSHVSSSPVAATSPGAKSAGHPGPSTSARLPPELRLQRCLVKSVKSSISG